MASIVSANSASAQKTPVPKYAAGISQHFPRPNKVRMLESSIASHQVMDVLPTNLGYNMRLADKYVEFIIPGSVGSFIDLSKLILTLNIALTKEDGTSIPDTKNVDVVNNIAQSLFKSVQCYLGDTVVETNVFYGYTSFVQLCTTIAQSKINTYCANTFTNLGGISSDKIDDTYFTNLPADRKKRIASLRKDGIQVCTPLTLEVCSVDRYLLDGIDVRIRLELASDAWLVLAKDNADKIKVQINAAKLLYTKLFPYPNALLALNSALDAGSVVQYTFTKNLVKSYILGANQISASYDLPYGSVIPEKLTLIMTKMESFAGAYNLNPLHFTSGNLSNITITVNGHSIYNVSAKFPEQYSELYYHTLDALGLHRDHLITYESFNKGLCVCVFDFKAENLEETLPVESYGNLRINLTLSEATTENRLVLLIGETLGIINVNSDRRIHCETRA